MKDKYYMHILRIIINNSVSDNGNDATKTSALIS